MKATNLKTYEDVPQTVYDTGSTTVSYALSRRLTIKTGSGTNKSFALPSVKGKRKHFTVFNLSSATIAITCAAANGTISNCAGVSKSTMNLVAAKGYSFEAIAGVWYLMSTIVTAAS